MARGGEDGERKWESEKLSEFIGKNARTTDDESRQTGHSDGAGEGGQRRG